MANIYTVSSITTSPILTTAGILDSPNGAPASGYNLVIEPLPGNDIVAVNFKVNEVTTSGATIPMVLSAQGASAPPNSQTSWPSLIEWTMDGLGSPDPSTSSGLKEFPAFYKVVLMDSDNLTNDSNFTGGGNNKVYVWIYFGHNENKPVQSITDMTIDIDIDYSLDPLTATDVGYVGVSGGGNITNFSI
jgi:hypothetical protein